MLQLSGLYYPNRFARYFFLAAEDILGQNGLNAVMSMAGLDRQLPPDSLERNFDFAHFAAFSQALEEMYGARGGRGMSLRIGRSWFERGMKTFGVLAGLSDPAFQVLPLERRCQIGLEALATVFMRYSDQRSILEVDASAYYFIVYVSPMAWERTADKTVCHAWVGLLQGCLNWSSNGYEFHVHESACSAMGSQQCVFVVNKKPVGQL